jgi:hypothetical protein
MSYTIHYGPEIQKLSPKKNGYAGFVGAVIILMVCSVAIGWAIPRQAEQFVQALFPWTRMEVRATLADLREEVKDGMPMADAISAFCHEIIYEAKIP